MFGAFIVRGLIAAVCCSLVSTAVIAETVPIRIEHFLPSTSRQHSQFFAPWGVRLEKESRGRFKTSVAAGIKPSELLGRVERSETDIAWIVPGYNPGTYPKLSVFELPWIASSRAAVTSLALQEYYETYAPDEFPNVKVLAVWCHSAGVIMSKAQQVRSPLDLKGQRIRSPTDQITALLSTLGAEPKQMPAPSAAKELDAGVIDGTVFPYEVIPTFGLQSRIRYITEFAGDRGFYTTVFLIVMSKKTYQDLPVDLKEVIDRNSGIALAGELGRLADDIETPGREAFEESGGLVSFAKGESYQEWYARAQPVVDGWVQDKTSRGLDGTRLLNAARSLVTKYTLYWMPR